MPIGILIINIMRYFKSAQILDELISRYFNNTADSTGDKKVNPNNQNADAGFSTIAGLALYLGFSSRKEMEDYEAKGKYAEKVKRARLRIMADYEKKLHVTSSTGAIFALKSMGWNDRPEPKPVDDAANTLLKVEVIQTGPPLAAAENEVIVS